MTEIHINPLRASNGSQPQNYSNYFIDAIALIFGAFIFSILAQGFFEFFFKQNQYGMGVLCAIITYSIYLAIFWRIAKKVIHTPFFSTSLLISIAIGTAIGTFITQNTPHEVFQQRYGLSGSQFLNYLQFDDVFHSWWYISLIIWLVFSLIAVTIRRKLSRHTIGFYLSHLSPILIFAGFWVDYFYGFRGIIKLEVGEQSNMVEVYRGNTGYIEGSKEIPLTIRLDAFESEKFEPDYRIQIWQNNGTELQEAAADGSVHMRMVPRIIASFPLIKDKIRHIYGTDLYFRLNEFFPEFGFHYDYPSLTDTIPPNNPGIMLKLKTALGEDIMQLRDQGTRRFFDPHIGAILEYYWELPAEVNKFVATIQSGQEKADSVRYIFEGSTETLYSFTDGVVESGQIELNNYYKIPSIAEIGFTPTIIFPDGKYLTARPGSLSDSLVNPVAKMHVWAKGDSVYQEAFIYPSRTRRGGQYSIFDSGYFLALESVKDMETKYWKSDIVAIPENGNDTRSKSIQVNEPLNYKAYRFYQTDYDPDNPLYSGIGVSYTPGLFIIYVGFFLLVAGCLAMFFLNHIDKKYKL